MQVALTSPGMLFDFRRYDVVPNVSWGLIKDGHECDLLCLSKSGVFHEVEIKVSQQDMAKDRLKVNRHRKPPHTSTQIHCVWFAVPHELIDAAKGLVPEFAGIISVGIHERVIPRFHTAVERIVRTMAVNVVRKPKLNKQARKPTEDEIRKFLRLGAMRAWSRRHELTGLLGDKEVDSEPVLADTEGR
jgi:hypothetical protein